jgi:hypothetical protein
MCLSSANKQFLKWAFRVLFQHQQHLQQQVNMIYKQHFATVRLKNNRAQKTNVSCDPLFTFVSLVPSLINAENQSLAQMKWGCSSAHLWLQEEEGSRARPGPLTCHPDGAGFHSRRPGLWFYVIQTYYVPLILDALVPIFVPVSSFVKWVWTYLEGLNQVNFTIQTKHEYKSNMDLRSSYP